MFSEIIGKLNFGTNMNIGYQKTILSLMNLIKYQKKIGEPLPSNNSYQSLK